MKKLTALAGLAATLAIATPAAAQDSASFAIMHFNMDADSASDMRMLPSMDRPMVVELQPGSTLAEVFSHFNMDVDSVEDMRGAGGVTIIMADDSAAAEIFARLMAESAEDE